MLSVYGMARCDLALFVLDFIHLGSSMFLHGFLRTDLSLLVVGVA